MTELTRELLRECLEFIRDECPHLKKCPGCPQCELYKRIDAALAAPQPPEPMRWDSDGYVCERGVKPTFVKSEDYDLLRAHCGEKASSDTARLALILRKTRWLVNEEWNFNLDGKDINNPAELADIETLKRTLDNMIAEPLPQPPKEDRLDDLEITKRCAQMMGLRYECNTEKAEYRDAVCLFDEGSNLWNNTYNPLWNDAQAMALVKKFAHLNFMCGYFDCEWIANVGISQPIAEVHHKTDLNRAICECVAKLLNPSEQVGNLTKEK